MKKSIHIVLIFFLTSSIFGQFSKYKYNPFSNTILFGIGSGLSQNETDFKNYEFGINSFGKIEYFIKNNSDLFYSIKISAGYANIQGNSSTDKFETDLISFGSTLGINYKLNRTFFIYSGIGINNNWYNDFSSISLSPELGINYLISEYIALNGLIAFNFMGEDNLDRIEVPGSNNDYFTTISVGISYAVDLTVTDDLDNDGILNLDDNCPEQEEDFDGFEDSDGCPEFDNDKDGIVDVKDICPNEAEDFDGFEDSNGCPDFDNDNDGILDENDTCPDLGEDFDGFEDSDGCPELDNDGDGIIDDNDACPEDAETFNNFEDSDGCPDKIPDKKINEEPPKKTVVPKEKKIVEKKIRLAVPNEFLLQDGDIFEDNSSRIKSSAFSQLDEIVILMKSNTELNWKIEGHLDNSGSALELKTLSKSKANSIMQYFIAKGLSPKLFKTVGMSDQHPIAPNSTIHGRMQNRRIVIKRTR